MEKATASSSRSFRCGDCGKSAGHTSPVQLSELGWKLLRLRDAYGNPTLWWRCPRCTRALGVTPST